MSLPLNIELSALRDLLGGRFVFGGSEDFIVATLGSPENSINGELCVWLPNITLQQRAMCRAPVIVIQAGMLVPQNAQIAVLEVPDSRRALWSLLDGPCRPIPGTWLSVEEITSRFGESARTSMVHSGAIIRNGVQIGAGVVVHDRVCLGVGVTVGDLSVIGSPGFGMIRDAFGNDLYPHWGGVDIGDHCWIGPQVNIAAGLLEPTTLGTGCRIDAQVQIGHNCKLGDECIIAGQVGIGGSVHLGRRCLVGGQAGFADHVQIGANCTVAARAGVTRSWGAGMVLSGFPAQAIQNWRREIVAERRRLRNHPPKS